MSAISDFNKVWVQKFPGSELPPAWEEDVKNNLAKHKKRVQELQNELKQEEVYVQFLESLLEEVEKRKKESSAAAAADGVGKRGGGGSNIQENQEKDIADVIKNTVERRSHFSGDNNLVPSSAQQASGVEEELGGNSNGDFQNNIKKDRSTHSLDSVGGGGCGDDLANIKNSDDSLSASQDLRGGGGTEDDASGEDNTDDSKDHFVTVIEVNGFEKEKAAALQAAKALQQSKTNGNSSEQMKQRLKKVPPRPPPKMFKRPESSSTNPAIPQGRPVSQPAAVPQENEHRKKDDPSKVDPHRPLVFESASSAPSRTPSGVTNGSSGNNNDSNSHSSNSTMSSTSSASKETTTTNNLNIFPRKTPAGKKFEGSKMPLPPPNPTTNNQQQEDNKDSNKNHKPSPKSTSSTNNSNSEKSTTNVTSQNNVRSKVFDLVSKMESGRAPPVPPQVPLKVNSNNGGGGGDQLTPKRSFRKKIQDPLYCTAHDAVIADYIDPLDVEYEGVTDQIYDCPPAESPEHGNINGGSSLDRNKKGGSKTSTMESRTSEKSGGGLGVGAEQIDDTDNEPMYDTVAPDVDDDYVVLLEGENQQQQKQQQQLQSSQKSVSANNSLSKLENKRLRENDYANTGINDAAATIKSQTSVISGHSINTTTSSGGTTSDTDGITGSPLPQDSHGETGGKANSNYVNIDYFLG